MSQRFLEFTPDDADRARETASVVLRMLQSGPKINKELSVNSLRYGASIKHLRELGWLIKTEQLRGATFQYTLVGYEKPCRVSKRQRNAYYGTAHWKRKRAERLQFDQWKCCHCRSTSDLVVHHWYYDLFHEDVEDLSTLCRTCHDRIHSYGAITIKFPKSVSVSIHTLLEESIDNIEET